MTAPPSAAAVAAPKLSTRQSEILSLIALGHSNQEIARHLGLTTGTVKQHIYVLYRKLRVRNRAMAVARGASLLPAATGDGARAPGGSDDEPAATYARRLVTAVVIEPRPAAVASSGEAADLERAFGALRARGERLAHSFDGRFEALPGGGGATWFGQPAAHGDDAARAVAFVQAVLGTTGRANATLPCAVGIGTAPEVVGEGARASLAFRAFRIATMLANFCPPGEAYACELSASLARIDGTPERTWRPAPGDLPVPARIVEGGPAPTTAVARLWGGLPFVPEIVASVRRRRMQWVAVESWPPLAGTRLIHALGESFALLRLPVHRLWMPTGTTPGGVAPRLVGQILGTDSARGERALDAALAALAANGPVCVLAYGVEALAGLLDAIGTEGVARLREVPIIFVAGAMHRSGQPQTVLRLLGGSPLGTPFARIFRMEVPAEGMPLALDIRPDVQAVLDSVSSSARAVARIASDPACSALSAVAERLGIPVQTVMERCRELESAGLIVVDEGRVHFRDMETIGAVRASMA